MLIHATLAMLLGLVILTGVGFGPALLILRKRGEEQAAGGVGQAPVGGAGYYVPPVTALALAVAPALALALFDILGFTLVMFVGPVRVWVWPVTAALLVISLVLTLVLWRRSGRRWVHRWQVAGGEWRKALRWLVWYAAVLALLVSPLLALGIQYTAFRANASDALFYMSLAETARTVEWGLIQKGMAFTAANLPNLERLAEAAPTALYTTRFIARPTSINHPTSMAWLAQLGGVPIYQFYYAFHMLLLAAAAPAVVAIGRLMSYYGKTRLRRSWLALAAAVVAVGFWARQVVEMDASYELSTVPVLALVVFAWMLVESRAGLRAMVLMAIGVAALTAIYFPVLAVFVTAMLLLGVLNLFRRRFKTYLLNYAAVAGLTFLVLLVSGQLVFQMRNLLVGPGVLEMQRDNTPATVQTMLNDGLAALIGLPARTLYGSALPALATAATVALQLGGIALLLVVAWWLWRGSHIREDGPRRVLAAVAAGGAVVFGLLLLDGNAKAAGKAFTYAYPYFLLLALTAADDLSRVGALRGSKGRGLPALVSSAVVGWLVLVLVVGSLLPYTSSASGVFRRGRANKAAHDFDLAPIAALLREGWDGRTLSGGQTPPLLVNTPRDDSWVFPYYVIQVLGGDPASYQSGLVIDNSLDYRNLWTHEVLTAPEYVLTAAAHDYLAGTGRADLMAETRDLRLYRVTDPDPGFFQAQTEAVQAADASERKPFPRWNAEP